MADSMQASDMPTASASMLVARPRAAQCLVAQRICLAILLLFLCAFVYHFTSEVKQQQESDPVVERRDVFFEAHPCQVTRYGHSCLENPHHTADLQHVVMSVVLYESSAGDRNCETVH